MYVCDTCLQVFVNECAHAMVHIWKTAYRSQFSAFTMCVARLLAIYWILLSTTCSTLPTPQH